MKKRIQRKLENRQYRIDNACSDCGTQLVIREFAKHHDKYLGDFVVPGTHQECPRCGLVRFQGDMYNVLFKMKEKRIKELLLKNYPPETNEYISEDEMCHLENCNLEDLLKNPYFNRWVYHLDLNGSRSYLKRSYELYKQTNRPGFFDLTYHHK